MSTSGCGLAATAADPGHLDSTAAAAAARWFNLMPVQLILLFADRVK